MKKVLIISSFSIVLLITFVIGYKSVSANTKIKEVDDIITNQEKKEKYLTHYNYTLDEPNIILNPYGNSPLTALIIFETKQEEEVHLTVKGKDNNSTYNNKFTKTKEHYIPIYGLYPNYNNEIIISCGDKTKTYKIKTNPLPNDLIIEKKENQTNKLSFINNNYPYAIDNNNEVRWYLNKKYYGNIKITNNGNLLLGNTPPKNSNYPNELLEIDLLGKVHKNYVLEKDYYGSYAETSNTYLILSKNILEIDKQNGLILREITIPNNYNKITYNNTTNKIILSNNEKSVLIDYNKEQIDNNVSLKKDKELLFSLYNNENYKITKGLKFTNNKETITSKKNIFLINYKNINNNYKRHNIDIIKEKDKLVINIILKEKEESYLILDKFLNKKIYKLKNGYNYINDTGLKGNYYIYIKINNTIYKTNKYITYIKEKESL